MNDEERAFEAFKQNGLNLRIDSAHCDLVALAEFVENNPSASLLFDSFYRHDLDAIAELLAKNPSVRVTFNGLTVDEVFKFIQDHPEVNTAQLSFGVGSGLLSAIGSRDDQAFKFHDFGPRGVVSKEVDQYIGGDASRALQVYLGAPEGTRTPDGTR